ncbi:MAG: AAA family ATPase [Clostridia bacterium]|nr:AAA family ATPase [Clostridia bacterium]
MNNIIAVVGMCGSGKSVAVEEFEKEGFQKIYFGQVTFDVLKERGLPVTPENERMVREELRASGDKGIYAKIYLPKIRELAEKGDVVIESMYSWSEYKYVKEEFGDAFKVLAIVTNAENRYQRLEIRGFRPLTRAESLKRDYTEIENIEKGGPIGIADFYITNNSDQKTFITKIQNLIQTIKD